MYVAELIINSTLQIPSSSDFTKNTNVNCGMWGINDFLAIIKVQHYSDSDSILMDVKKRDDVK